MYPVLFHIGPLTLHTYGLMVALGFLAAYAVARREFDRQGFPALLLDKVVFLLMISGIIGARLFYFSFEAFSNFKKDPLSFLRIWEGGLVYYGAFIGGVSALGFYARLKRISFLKLLDALIGPLLIGQAIGRLGCFFAGCCYGKPTNIFWGVTFTNIESLAPPFVRLHPTQLYSAFGDFLLFLGFLFLRKKSPVKGILSSYYLIAYGIFRFLIEFLRDDYRGPVHGGLTPSQWICLGSVLIGLALIFYVRKKTKTEYHT